MKTYILSRTELMPLAETR